jgi:hypothetical protein
MTLDEVIGLSVMARRGRVNPPERTRRALALLPKLPGRTDDDHVTDRQGRTMSAETYVQDSVANLGLLTAALTEFGARPARTGDPRPIIAEDLAIANTQ